MYQHDFSSIVAKLLMKAFNKAQDATFLTWLFKAKSIL